MKIMYKNGRVVSDYFNEYELASAIVYIGGTLGNSKERKLYTGITSIAYNNDIGWPWVNICEFSNVLSNTDEYQVEVFNSTSIVSILEKGPIAEILGIALQLLRDHYVEKGIVNEDIDCIGMLEHAYDAVENYNKKGEEMKLVVTEQGSLSVVNFNERLFAENVDAIMDKITTEEQVGLMIAAFHTANILAHKKGTDVMLFETEGDKPTGVTSYVHTAMAETLPDGIIIENLGWMLAWATDYYSGLIDFEDEEENSLLQVIKIIETKQEGVSDEN